VDGKKRLTIAEREVLLSRIELNEHSHPIRRVWIEVPGKSKRRPLGIPTIEDRAKQMLAKLALEPEWEAKFEPHSLGYRPGRRTMEMTWRARHKIRYGVYWVLDADVSKFFERIKHGITG
jgi:RNA-directed DNA polymerase